MEHPMKNQPTPTGDPCPALLELLRDLSEIFWGPDLEKVRTMRAEGYFRPLQCIRPVLAPGAQTAAERIETLVGNFRDDASLLNGLEEKYIALFVNTRGGIKAPLYQSCYPEPGDPLAEAALMGTSAVRMQQRFSAAGLGLDSGLGEPPDHLAIELEYLYFLLKKGWGENDKKALLEAASFVKTELLEWVPRFENRLQSAYPESFYALAAVILVGTLRQAADFLPL
jgi:putative dimethyl sulfoxide reductase chaperone